MRLLGALVALAALASCALGGGAAAAAARGEEAGGSGDGGAFDVSGVVVAPKAHAFTSTPLVLNGKTAGVVRQDGSFVLRDLAPGSYSLEVGSTVYGYPLYLVNVADSGRVSAQFWVGKRRRELTHPLRLEPFGEQDYFEPRKTLSISSLFMNPMLLMMAVMMGLMFLLPKLQEGMDPEELKKMQEDMRKQQLDQPDPQKLLGSMFGGGGSTADDSDSD